MYLQVARCPICGVEFRPEVKSIDDGEAEVRCPNGHVFTIHIDNDAVFDCEIRDWERFGLLPQTIQHAVLEAIQSGRIPRELRPLMTRLKDAGVVVCT
ncbi:hypothetical protein [Pyrobaculum neutrophilum]|uniref:Family 562 protein n=1 Tax=Pyrobaculum neutrophilum (strain DSM 2338 / JCM 9278 / NBRC 100436 / V24Sta) TaxID=444157 RepID=B1Y9H8_PYRNV|nr:hypothetical protein [Pyrobaculum neutrophilum]ACB40407.1 family 562 protein [Pyrobaculum neutrophilum V24Sta]